MIFLECDQVPGVGFWQDTWTEEKPEVCFDCSTLSTWQTLFRPGTWKMKLKEWQIKLRLEELKERKTFWKWFPFLLKSPRGDGWMVREAGLDRNTVKREGFSTKEIATDYWVPDHLPETRSAQGLSHIKRRKDSPFCQQRDITTSSKCLLIGTQHGKATEVKVLPNAQSLPEAIRSTKDPAYFS